jgi:hypothetical protein
MAITLTRRGCCAIRMDAQLVACYVFEQRHGQEFPVGGPEAGQGTAVGLADNIG